MTEDAAFWENINIIVTVATILASPFIVFAIAWPFIAFRDWQEKRQFLRDHAHLFPESDSDRDARYWAANQDNPLCPRKYRKDARDAE